MEVTVDLDHKLEKEMRRSDGEIERQCLRQKDFAPAPPFVGSAGTDRLFAQQHMSAPVLFVADFIVVGTERAIFAIRYDGDLFRIHTQIDQDTPGCLGPFFAKNEVVIVSATFITMTRNFKERLRIVL